MLFSAAHMYMPKTIQYNLKQILGYIVNYNDASGYMETYS